MCRDVTHYYTGETSTPSLSAMCAHARTGECIASIASIVRERSVSTAMQGPGKSRSPRVQRPLPGSHSLCHLPRKVIVDASLSFASMRRDSSVTEHDTLL